MRQHRVWVAPPNWPAPPAGFVPAPGWQPDPAWGPPPTGWQFWQEVHPDDPSHPGLLERLRESRAQHHAQHLAAQHARAYEHAKRDYENQLHEWQDRAAAIQESLTSAEEFFGLDSSEATTDWVLKKGERVYVRITAAGLIELKRSQGHYVGGYQGVSFRIAKGVSYRVGGARGHYIPGPESPTIIDNGDVVISDQRVLFRGDRQSREWAFAKLIGYSPAPDGSWMALQVSNRQKVSGIGYGASIGHIVEQRLQLAIATFQGGRDAIVAHLRQELAVHQQHKPVAPAPPAVAGQAAT